MANEFNIISEYTDETIAYNHVKFLNPSDNDFLLHLHTHDICEFLFLKSGNISGIINASAYKPTKNCLLIFRPRVPHRIQIEDATAYERYDILFDENLLANKVFYKLPKEVNLINLNGNNHVIDLFKKMDYYYKQFTGDDLKVIITNLVEEILFNISIILPSDDFDKNLITTHPIISKAINYINSHYTEDIKIEDISKHLGITKSHLHHLFVENLQVSPKKFMNIKRLVKAQHLIRMGEAPSNIYLSCGFNEYTTFFRNYISYFGHSPSEENKLPIERKFEDISPDFV
ncbi:MAG: helix-turn-helix domain-containing protein [Ruminococcaceae bacterium]|nr:helix-turn-helix domain-containing protein [Oscillospiraceae bacterium]